MEKLKTEEILYLRKVVKADVKLMELGGPKRDARGHALALKFRKRVLKQLEHTTS